MESNETREKKTDVNFTDNRYELVHKGYVLRFRPKIDDKVVKCLFEPCIKNGSICGFYMTDKCPLKNLKQKERSKKENDK